MNARRTLYPEIEPFASGWLDVGDGHRIFWEECGNPNAKPAVFLHGGPGGGCVPDHRRYFDPEVYRVVLFDQRGCGRSTPHTSDPNADLSANTTWHLVEDMERLREFRGIDRWQVFGGSWGSTLALAYAERYPDRVTELVLRGIFTLRTSELDWFYEGGAGHLFPEAWAEYVAQVSHVQAGQYIPAYAEQLADPDPGVHVPAALAWSQWEHRTVRLIPDHAAIDAARADVPAAVAFARIENHFFANAGWLEEGQLIRDASRLAEIPGVIVQGRYDVCTPAVTAWDLAQAWPQADLEIIQDAGHASSEPGIVDALVRATDRFAKENHS